MQSFIFGYRWYVKNTSFVCEWESRVFVVLRMSEDPDQAESFQSKWFSIDLLLVPSAQNVVW